jgi:HAE1 family hydrophobic/amphiphilic exporter-1
VVIYGRDTAQLQHLSDAALAALSGVEGLQDVQSSLQPGFPELRVRYDRLLLERLGLSAQDVAQSIRNRIQGVQATRISRGTRTDDLVVRLVEGDRSGVSDLESLNVNPKLQPPLPLSSVASIERAEGPSEIRRVDQQRAVVISANLVGFDLGGVGQSIDDALSGLSWPQGADFEVSGQSREMSRSLSSLGFALGLAVFLVYVIMASTFESLLHPFVILTSLPLALVGVVGLLLPLGSSLSVVVLIGLIVLAGVVVNNAIVLVDFVNRLRGEGRDLETAILEAGRARLRPIVITTSTTVLGLLPLGLGFGEGAEIQQPLALTLMGGLVSATLLTLWVVPTVYRTLGALERR